MLSIVIFCPVFHEEAAIEIFQKALIEATEPLYGEYKFRFIYAVAPLSAGPQR